MCDQLFEVIKLRDLKGNGIDIPNDGGIYKWWCIKELFEKLILQLQKHNPNLNIGQIENASQKNDDGLYCFYVGKAGTNLHKRIRSQHIGKDGKKNPTEGRAIKGSTLRRSINALKNGGHNYDENYVDNILNQCYVQWEDLDSQFIENAEKKEINAYVRLLNLKDIEFDGSKRSQIQKELCKALSSARNS